MTSGEVQECLGGAWFTGALDRPLGVLWESARVTGHCGVPEIRSVFSPHYPRGASGLSTCWRSPRAIRVLHAASGSRSCAFRTGRMRNAWGGASQGPALCRQETSQLPPEKR